MADDVFATVGSGKLEPEFRCNGPESLSSLLKS